MFRILFTVLFLGAVHSEYSGDNCLDGNKPGVCIAQSQCQSLLDEVKAADRKYMIRRLRALRCGWNTVEPLVCCVPKETPSKKEAQPVPEGINSSKRSNIGTVTGPPDVQGHRNLDLLPKDCGVSENYRIWGGNKTALFEMPWMVLLSYSGTHMKFDCGGTLINQWYVLTAAHCVEFLGRTQKLESVILGEYDVESDPDCGVVDGFYTCAPKVTETQIAQVIAHPGYNPTTNHDDIALLRLAQPANFTLDSMKPICLPVTRNLQNEMLEGVNSTLVAGWGITETSLQSPVLLSVDLPVMRQKDCAAYFKNILEISEKHLCAGGVPDKDSCGGDSGGPLMYPGIVRVGGARYVQRGIVSLGSRRCGVKGFPSVFTRTAYYMDWILDNIRA